MGPSYNHRLETPLSNRNRVFGLDTLRALAISFVFFFHLPHKDVAWIRGVAHIGWVGVDLFFVLSGYLIGNQLFQSLRRTQTINLADFYWRRSLRILPAFWGVLAIYFWWPEFRESKLNVSIWRFLTFTMNFNLHFGAFSNAWSLCIEEQFYWLFPLIALFFSRNRRSSVFVGFALGSVLLLGMLVRGVLWSQVLRQHLDDTALNRSYYQLIYYPTFSRLDGLTAGISLALVKNYWSSAWEKMGDWGNALSVLGVALVTLALFLFEKPFALVTVVLGFPIIALGCASLVASAAAGRTRLSRFRIPGATTVATLAYSIYLTHKPISHLVTRLLEERGVTEHPRVTLGLVIIAALAAGLILHLGIERPFLLLRERKRRPFVPPLPGGLRAE